MPSSSSIVRGAFGGALAVARCDPLRPAATVAFAMAAVEGIRPDPPWLGPVIAAMAAVAAMGELPAERRGRSAANPTLVVAAGRLAMPCLGLLVGVLAGSILGVGVGAGPIAAATAAVVSTAAATAAMRSAGVSTCDAASACLSVGVVAPVCGIPAPWLAVGWPIAAAVTAWACNRLVAGELADLPRLRGRTAWYTPVPGQGRVRGRLTAIAMAACLAAMAGWLLRDPPDVPSYATLAVGALASLAIPMATLGEGAPCRREWSAVVFSRRATSRLPWRATGTLGRWGSDWPPSARIAFGYAALVAWPLLVAAVIPGPSAPRFTLDHALHHHVVAVALVGITATAIVVVARTLAWQGVHPETAMALLLMAIAIGGGLLLFERGGLGGVLGGVPA